MSLLKARISLVWFSEETQVICAGHMGLGNRLIVTIDKFLTKTGYFGSQALIWRI